MHGQRPTALRNIPAVSASVEDAQRTIHLIEIKTQADLTCFRAALAVQDTVAAFYILRMSSHRLFPFLC